MRLIRGLHNLRATDRGCVATIGNFDGVHLGHRTVFQRLLARGRELGLPATVITFEPQPMEFFAPDAAPARLTRLREKLDAIRNDGIEQVMLLEFGPKLAAMDARTFVQRLLLDGLGVRFLLVGDDFRFGQGRDGGLSTVAIHGRASHPQRSGVSRSKICTPSPMPRSASAVPGSARRWRKATWSRLAICWDDRIGSRGASPMATSADKPSTFPRQT